MPLLPKRRDTGSEVEPRAEKLVQLGVSALVFWLPAVAFFKIAEEIREQEGVRVDSAFLEWLHGFATPILDRVAIGVTTLGGAPVITVGALLITAWLVSRRFRRAALFVAGSVGGAAATDVLLKLWFRRARPSLWSPVITEPDYSFPSGHAMLSMVLALVVASLLWKTRWRTLSLILGAVYVFLIGLSRLYLGVHFPTDVVAGWCAGSIWVAIVARLLRLELRGAFKRERVQKEVLP